MSTTEAAPEATEAAPAEPEAEKVKRDWNAELAAAFVKASNAYGDIGGDEPGLPEDVVKAVQDAFREVPAAARGNAQALALKAVLTEGNADALESVLDAVSNMPKATGKTGTGRGRKPKVEVDPVAEGTKLGAAILTAWAEITSDPEHGAAINEAASALFQNGIEDEAQRLEVIELAGRVVKAVNRSRGGGGGGGTRKTFTETLADLIGDGRIKAPANVNMGETSAKILKNGTVRIGDRDFDNLSAAAKFAKDPAAYDAGTSKVSLNGWDAWQIANPDGEGTVAVGSLRNK
jgi:hypothetical protein